MWFTIQNLNLRNNVTILISKKEVWNITVHINEYLQYVIILLKYILNIILIYDVLIII